MILGLNHLTLSVSNLEKSFEFYTKILGCQPVAKWKRGAYLLAGDLWLCLSLDKNTRTSPLKEYTHISFSISNEKLQHYRNYLKSNIIQQWQENTSEGTSLYIIDPDGHKLELHIGDLRSRIEAIKKAPYEEMEFFEL
ncbi:MAG: VOC family protein [Prochloraceae cyanobacterium]|nr:VOC family protein [Prochloraceae cyanobacterium]